MAIEENRSTSWNAKEIDSRSTIRQAYEAVMSKDGSD